MSTPTEIANEALDQAGCNIIIGDLTEGTHAAQVCLRSYSTCRQQLLRAAHWQFARKEAPMVLLADATGQTPDVGTMVPTSWIYEYAYPIDCLQVICVPWNCQIEPGTPPGNYGVPATPQVSNLGQQPIAGGRIIPARYLVAFDPNYPADPASLPSPGTSPAGSKVVLTNVKNAKLIYTTDQLYPEIWDGLFRQAMISYMAQRIAVPLHEDKKLGVAMRNQQIEIVKKAVMDARTADGREAWISSDLAVDWMQVRNSGGPWSGNNGWGGFGQGMGQIGSWGGYDGLTLANGSAF